MHDLPTPDKEPALPSLLQLGPELGRIGPWRRLFSLSLPFFYCTAYFVLASLDCWPLAVLALIALSFVTYGSTSHDLVHRNLGLPRTLNDILLCVIELLGLRSGHAYQAVHLRHHASYPSTDDVEAQAARKSWFGAILEGTVFQFRITLWALKNAPEKRIWIVGEGAACVVLVALSAALAPRMPIYLTYVVLMVMGSWIIPLITSYLPHDPQGKNELFQTRVFRGKVASILAVEHLYHLEHHLYPAVPHQNWPRLAKLLDPIFANAGVKPIKFWF